VGKGQNALQHHWASGSASDLPHCVPHTLHAHPSGPTVVDLDTLRLPFAVLREERPTRTVAPIAWLFLSRETSASNSLPAHC